MDEMTLTLKRIAWLDATILPDYYDVVFDGGIRDGKLHRPITALHSSREVLFGVGRIRATFWT